MEHPGPSTTASLLEARRQYIAVKARYRMLSPLLQDHQRRLMRTYLARLAGLVRQAEQSHWACLQAAELALAPDTQATVELAIARAAAAASVIAAAVHSDAPVSGENTVH